MLNVYYLVMDGEKVVLKRSSDRSVVTEFDNYMAAAVLFKHHERMEAKTREVSRTTRVLAEALVKDGQKIEAIKYVRQNEPGYDLLAAKEYVEDLIARIHMDEVEKAGKNIGITEADVRRNPHLSLRPANLGDILGHAIRKD